MGIKIFENIKKNSWKAKERGINAPEKSGYSIFGKDRKKEKYLTYNEAKKMREFMLHSAGEIKERIELLKLNYKEISNKEHLTEKEKNELKKKRRIQNTI
jgi:DNA repair ATPase RecN